MHKVVLRPYRSEDIEVIIDGLEEVKIEPEIKKEVQKEEVENREVQIAENKDETGSIFENLGNFIV